MTSEAFEADYARAVENFKVTSVIRDVDVVYVEAEADTMSRYVVVATVLPVMARVREGATHCVAVLQPWQDACAMMSEGYLDRSYVAEKLTAGRAREGRLNGGDLAALTYAVRCALGREGDGS